MSQELTKEAKLTALVLVAPPKPHPSTHYCALHRAGKSIGYDYDAPLANHYDVASMLGFNEAEARGIMSGWDKAHGGNVVRWETDPKAEELGAHLHSMACEDCK